jgi:SAM-dependent methyltransferase
MGAAIKTLPRYRELLIGAGERRKKLIYKNGHEDFDDLTTLDVNRKVKPDVVWDLNQRPLPFEDNTFDEIHAYEVLEHIGRQGDWVAFFMEFSEYWRILKPTGLLSASVPRWDNIWAWSDPGHVRVITEGTLMFLSQPNYTNPDKGPMTDYRNVYKADFEIVHNKQQDVSLCFGLAAIKPSRYQEGR